MNPDDNDLKEAERELERLFRLDAAARAIREAWRRAKARGLVEREPGRLLAALFDALDEDQE